MDREILFRVNLIIDKASRAWAELTNQIKSGNSGIFSAIEKTVKAFNSQEESINKVSEANNKLVFTQEKIINNSETLKTISTSEINILKSQILEKEKVNAEYLKENQFIQTSINGYQALQKERRQEIETLKLANKERENTLKALNEEIKANNNSIKTRTLTNVVINPETNQKEVTKTPLSGTDISNILRENQNLTTVYNNLKLETDKLNFSNELKIKTIQDEINQTQALINQNKELLNVEKLQSQENQNFIKDTQLKIKSKELENKAIQESLRSQKELDQETIQDIQLIKNKITVLDSEKAKIQEKIAELRNLNITVQATTEVEKGYKTTVLNNISDLTIQKNSLQEKINIFKDQVKILENNTLAEDLSTISIKNNNEALKQQKEGLKQLAESEKAKKQDLADQKEADLYLKQLDKKDALQKQSIEKQLQAEQAQAQKEKAIYDEKAKMYTKLFMEMEKLEEQKRINAQKLLVEQMKTSAVNDLNYDNSKLLDNQKRVREEQAKARQDEINKINGKISTLATEASAIQSNINAQIQLKNSTKGNSEEALKYKSARDKDIDSLKNQKREITDEIRLLANKKSALDNTNVSIVNNTRATNENLNALAKQRDIINSLPKNDSNNSKSREDLSFFEKLIERIANYTIGTILSQSIRKVFQEITQFINQAISEFISLERNIAIIRGLLDDTNRSFGEINGKITETAEKTGSSFSGTSEALNQIITKGITDINEAMKVYSASIVLARVSANGLKNEQQNLNDVINTAVLIMNNYKIKAEKLPIVFNQMSIAASKSKLDIGDFSKYIGGLSSMFAPLGASLNESMALFALFSNRLESASRADTALRAILKKIQTPSGNQKNVGENLGIDFTPSAVQEKGLISWVKDFMAKVSKTASPDDTLANMFSLQTSKKGLSDLLDIFKTVNKEGKNALEELSSITLNNTDDLNQKYEKVINTFSQKWQTFSNSFINIFMGVLVGSKDQLDTYFDDFIFSLNIAIDISKQFFAIFDIGNGENALFNFGSWLGSGLKFLLMGLSADIEFLTKLFRVLFVGIDGFIALISQGFLSIAAIIKGFTWDSITKGTSKALDDLTNFLNTAVSRVKDKSKEMEKSLKDLFDFDNYATINPTITVKNRLENGVQKGQKEEFLPPTALVGTGEIDKNSEKIKEVLKDIDKATGADEKFSVKRRQSLDKYKEDIAVALREYEKIQNVIPKQLEKLQLELVDPTKNDQEKKKILDDIENLNKTKLNSEKNYHGLLIQLEKRKNAEIAKINEEERKKLETEKKKAIDSFYGAKIDTQKTKINDISSNNENLSKIDLIKEQNKELKKEADLYHAWGMAFNAGSKDRSERLKQESERIKQIGTNNRNIQKEQIKESLDNSEKKYKSQLNQVRFFAEDVKLAEDQRLNNESAIDKNRVSVIKKELANSKLSFDQKKKLADELLSLENKISTDVLKIRDIRRERQYNQDIYEIDQTKTKYETLVKLAIGSQEQLDLLEIENNKQKIKIAEAKRGSTKDIDEIEKYNREIFALQTTNQILMAGISERIKDESKRKDEKRFSDTLKSIDFLKSMTIKSEKEAAQEKIKANEDYLKILNTQQKDFIDTYGEKPVNENKQKELEGLSDKIKEFNQNIALDNKNLNEIIIKQDKEALNLKIATISSVLDVFKKIGETAQKNNFSSLGNIAVNGSDTITKAISSFNDLTEAQNKYKAAQNQEDKDKIKKEFDSGFINFAIKEVITSINTLIDLTPKMLNELNKLSSVQKAFGVNSKEFNNQLQISNELFAEQLKIIPVVGGLMSSLTRGFTDLIGVTKSEEQKKKDQELLRSDYELNLAKVRQAKQSSEQKLLIEKIEYEEKKRKLQDAFTSQDIFDRDLEKLEIEHNSTLINIKEENVLKLLEIETNYKNASYGIQKDSYENKRSQLYADYLLEFQRLQNQGAVQKEYDTAYKNYLTNVALLDLENKTKTIDIEYELQKSIINLQSDSKDKSLSLAQLDHDHKLSLLEDEKTKGLVTLEQYLNKKQIIENELSSSIIQINNDSSQKLRDLNDKSYNEELKAFDTLNKTKLDKLKTDLQKAYDIQADYQNKLDELRNKRNDDQEAKTKRAEQLKIDRAKKASELSRAFFEQNQDNFENAIGTGNKVKIAKTENDFLEGSISLEERNRQRKQAALEKELFYENLILSNKNPNKVAEYNAEIASAKQDYYDFVFDKEKEAIDLEKVKADRSIITLQKQLDEQQKIETNYIKQLDEKYKTSAGLYKDSFIQATKDWIEYAKTEGLQKLGVSTYETLQQVGNNLNKNANEAKKYIGNTNTPVTTNNQTTGNLNPSINLNKPVTNSVTPNSTNNGIHIMQPATPNSTTSGNETNKFNGFGVTIPPTYAEQQQMKINYLDKVLASMYGASEYNRLFDQPLDVIIARMEALKIPFFEDGGVTNGLSIAGEKGKPEAIFNFPQMKNMYDFVKNAVSGSNYNNSSKVIQIIFGDIILNGVDLSDTGKLSSILDNRFNKYAQKIQKGIYNYG